MIGKSDTYSVLFSASSRAGRHDSFRKATRCYDLNVRGGERMLASTQIFTQELLHNFACRYCLIIGSSIRNAFCFFFATLSVRPKFFAICYEGRPPVWSSPNRSGFPHVAEEREFSATKLKKT